MRVLVPLVASVLLVCGCASNSGVVAIGSSIYMVSRQAATGFSGKGTLKADAMKEANDFCIAQNKTMKILSTDEAEPPFIFGNFPKAEVQFSCVESNSSGPTAPPASDNFLN